MGYHVEYDEAKANEMYRKISECEEVLRRMIKVKPNEYKENGILKDLSVGDYIVRKDGRVTKIWCDDDPSLKAEDIARFATIEEINNHLSR